MENAKKLFVSSRIKMFDNGTFCKFSDLKNLKYGYVCGKS